MTAAGTPAAVLSVAVLDADVLYPQFLRDVMLRVAAADLYAPRWTERIHAEGVRSVADDFGIDPAKLASTVARMNAVFPSALVTNYEPLEAAFPDVHPKDRHVAAAALAAGANLLVTWNRKDFPQRALTLRGIRRMSPDELLTGLLTADPKTVVAVLMQHRVGLQRPPHDHAAYRRAFIAAGLKRAAALRP